LNESGTGYLHSGHFLLLCNGRLPGVEFVVDVLGDTELEVAKKSMRQMWQNPWLHGKHLESNSSWEHNPQESSL